MYEDNRTPKIQRSGKQPFWTRGKRIFAFVLTIVIIVISVLLASSSWVNVGVGEGLLVVDAQTRSVNDVITGPAAGFFQRPQRQG